MRLSKLTYILLVVSLAFVMAGCQSTAATSNTEIVKTVAAQEAVPSIPPAPVPAPAPEAEPAVAEEALPVETVYTYCGYTLDIKAYDGRAVIAYPEIVTAEDIDSFLASEVAAYPEMTADISYAVDGKALTLFYPEGITEAERRAMANILATDIIETAAEIFNIPSSEPVTIEYIYGNYSLKVVIGEAGAEVTGYEDYLSSEEIEGFIASENAKYSSLLGGVYYTVEEPGTIKFTYPEDVTKTDVAAFTQLIVTDLISEY